MPAERAKKTKTPDDVPGEGDPDRKRVLNILAQRRYRQRRREKIAALEAQASGATTTIRQTESEGSSEGPTTGPSGSNGDIGRTGQFGQIDMSTETSPMHPTSVFDFAQGAFDLSMSGHHDFISLPTPLPSTPSSSAPHFPLAADCALVSVPILDVLRAFASIAVIFDVATTVWDLDYLHVLPSSIPGASALPANLHPIPAQYNIPHHPLLDLLPWPGVRERLICMLAMPSKLRPPVAQEDGEDILPTGGIKQTKAIMQLAQDIDENQDGLGIRVHGNSTTWAEGNELVEDSWEIGDLFYRKWWWCLDQRIVETSNRRRRERGLPRLRWNA